MSRKTPPHLVDQIAALAKEGHTQTAIAHKLGISQPRVSQIMRAHHIALASDPIYNVGGAAYQVPEGEMRISVQITVNHRPIKTVVNGTPAQLQEITDLAARLYREQQPPGVRFVLGVVDRMIENDTGDR